MLLLFRLGLKPLVEAADAVSRICEPDRAVGSHHDVVWRIEPLAVVAVGDHGDGPVELGPDHAPAAMLAAHQASLTVSGVPVRIHRRRTEDTQAAVVLDDAHHPVVGDVAEEQIMPGAEIRGSLGPAETGGDPLSRAC